MRTNLPGGIMNRNLIIIMVILLLLASCRITTPSTPTPTDPTSNPTPTQPTPNPTSTQPNTPVLLSTKEAAHNERIYLPVSTTENLKVTLDNKDIEIITIKDNKVLIDLAVVSNLEMVTARVYSSDSLITEQEITFLSTLTLGKFTAVVEDTDEATLTTLAESRGLKLLSYKKQSSSNLAVATLELADVSTEEALAGLSTLAEETDNKVAISPTFVYKPVMRIPSLDPSCDFLPELKEEIEQWKPIYISDEDVDDSLLEFISAKRAHTEGTTGTGVFIAMLDSGYGENDDFDCVSTDYKEGHGTHTFNLAKSIAPGATILPIKLCSKEGICSSDSIAEALLRLEEEVLFTGQRLIINVSLSGAPHPSTQIGLDSSIYKALLDLANKHDNLLVVASAGNNGLDETEDQEDTASTIDPKVRYPAGFWSEDVSDVKAITNLISVGSIGLRSSSFLGKFETTAFTPPVGITMVAPGVRLCFGTEATGCAPANDQLGLIGSSFSAPIVAGSAALFWEQCPDLSGAELRKLLQADKNFDIEVANNDATVVNAYKTLPCSLDASNVEVSVKPDATSLNINQGLKATALIDNKDSDRIQWTSLNPDIATVNSTGYIQAKKTGTTTIEIKSLDNPAAKAQIKVSVNDLVCNNPVRFSDNKLRDRIIEVMELNTTELSCDQMATLPRLFAMERKITSLVGLEHATNITWLNVGTNNISDLSPLSNLKNLETAYVFLNDLDGQDLGAFAPLEKLELLSIHQTNITDISAFTAMELPSLRKLYMDRSKIQDPSPLANYTQLTLLSLDDNNISDINSLARLTNLKSLRVGRNKLITDISAVRDMTQLEELYIYENKITDLTPLSKLTNLRVLMGFDNNISDISPLRDLKLLFELVMYGNQISDVSSLVGFENLSYLGLDRNKLTHLNDVAKLTSLNKLQVAENNITDISPITTLKNLTFLDIAKNTISNIEAVKELKNLRELYFYYPTTKISDISVIKDLVLLEKISFPGNDISDISVLQNLTKLNTVHLAANKIIDLSPLINNSGIDQDDDVSLIWNPLDFKKGSQDVTDIYTLINRGVTIEIDPFIQPQSVSSYTTMMHKTDEFSLNGYAPDDANGRNIDLWTTNFNDGDQQWELFKPNTLTSINGAVNEGWMIRRKGTSLCLVSRPEKSSTAFLWRCYIDDPFQQWNPTYVEEVSSWFIKLKIPSEAGVDFCLQAYQPAKQRNVDMWECDRNDPDQRWDLSASVNGVLGAQP